MLATTPPLLRTHRAQQLGEPHGGGNRGGRRLLWGRESTARQQCARLRKKKKRGRARPARREGGGRGRVEGGAWEGGARVFVFRQRLEPPSAAGARFFSSEWRRTNEHRPPPHSPVLPPSPPERPRARAALPPPRPPSRTPTLCTSGTGPHPPTPMAGLPPPTALAVGGAALALTAAPPLPPGAADLAASIERVSAALKELGDTVTALQRGERRAREDIYPLARQNARGHAPAAASPAVH